MTVRANLVAELINDTMIEVWKAGESIGPNVSVSLAIMRLAYARVRRFLAAARVDEPRYQHLQDSELSTSLETTASPSDLPIFLSKLSVEERAVLHFVYASRCSRRETAEVMEVTCDCVDVLLGDVRSSAKLHLVTTPAQTIPR
jgi:DNA-directed RNA polymerase specialized sigma24 family protein